MKRKLNEDEIDDLLDSARSNDLNELKNNLNLISTRLECAESDVISHTIDVYSKNTLLHMASANGLLEIILFLLSFNINNMLSFKNESGNTPLHWACLNGHLNIVKTLCDFGASPFEKNNSGQDCIFQAETNEKFDVVDYLLERYQDEEEV
ncbi:ankyrin repeat-containing domain protein [Lipomyces arxii]|uniref:ankyrin repeat-containing domain protein n=1 Tax=Lipomyces arxii TaxID=56418 RepID=UPI0034CE2379